MEVAFAPSSTEKPISPFRRMRSSPKKNTRSFISRSSSSAENLAPILNNIPAGGIFYGPPPPSLSFSYPPYPFHQRQEPPPLLPLPVSKPYASLPPPTARKANRRDVQSLTPKKSKQPTKRESPRQQKSIAKPRPEALIVASTVPIGPDPNDLPKDVSMVLSPPPSFAGNNSLSSVAFKDLDGFSGSVFTISPPPSSLPLPKFSMRQKLSCNAEAGGIDAGATDNLRRILRLR